MIFYYKQINIVLFATSEHIVITISFLSLKEINYSILKIPYKQLCINSKLSKIIQVNF